MDLGEMILKVGADAAGYNKTMSAVEKHSGSFGARLASTLTKPFEAVSSIAAKAGASIGPALTKGLNQIGSQVQTLATRNQQANTTISQQAAALAKVQAASERVTLSHQKHNAQLTLQQAALAAATSKGKENEAQLGLRKAKIAELEGVMRRELSTLGQLKTQEGELAKASTQATQATQKQGTGLGQLGNLAKSAATGVAGLGKSLMNSVGQLTKNLWSKLTAPKLPAADTRTFKSSLDQAVQHSHNASQQIGGAFGRIKDIIAGVLGAKLVQGFVNGVRGLVGGVLQVAGDFESQMNILTVAARSSGTSLADLRQAALNVGKDTQLVGINSAQAGEAMETFYKAGLKTSDIFADLNGYLAGTVPLTGALRSAIDLQAASELDLAQSSEIVSVAMATFGISAQEAGRITNSFVQAADASNASVGDLADALKNAGPTMAAYGWSLEDTNTALAILSTRGIAGAEAGTNLKSMMTNMLRPTDDVKMALKSLNVTLYDSEGRMRPLPDIIGQLSAALDTNKVSTSRVSTMTKEQGAELKRLQGIYKSAERTINDYSTGVKGAGQSEKARNTALDKARATMAAAEREMQPLIAASGEYTTVVTKMTEEQRNEIIQTLAGTYGMKAMNTLLSEGTAGWEKMTQQIGAAATAQEVGAARTQGYQATMEQLRGALETLMIEGGQPFIEGLTKIIAQLGEVAGRKDVSAFVVRLGKGLGSLAGAVAGVIGHIARMVNEFKAAIHAAGARGAANWILQTLGLDPQRAGKIANQIDAIRKTIQDKIKEFRLRVAFAAFAGGTKGTGAGSQAYVLLSMLGLSPQTALAVGKAIDGLIPAIKAQLEKLKGAVALGRAEGGAGAVVGNVLGLLGLPPDVSGAVATAIGNIQKALGEALKGGDLLGGLTGIKAEAVAGAVDVGGAILDALAKSFPGLSPLIEGLVRPLLELGGQIATTFMSLSSEIGPMIMNLVQGILPMAQQLLPQIIGIAGQLIGIVSDNLPLIQSLITTVAGLLTTTILPLLPQMLALVAQLLPVFASLFSTVAPLIGQVVSALVPLVAQLLPQIAPIVALIAGAISQVLPIVVTLAGAILSALPPIIASFLNLAQAVLPIVLAVFGGLVSFVVANLPAITTVVTGVIDTITGIVRTFAAVLQGDWAGAWNSLKGTFETAISLVVSAIKANFGMVLGILDTLFSDILGVFEPGEFSKIAKALIDGFIGGLKSAWGGLKGLFSQLIGQLPEWAQKILGVASPSKVFAEIGSEVSAGMAQGIAGGAGDVTGALGAITEAMFEFIRRAGGNGLLIRDLGKGLEALAEGLGEFANMVKSLSGVGQGLDMGSVDRAIAQISEVMIRAVAAVQNIGNIFGKKGISDAKSVASKLGKIFREFIVDLSIIKTSEVPSLDAYFAQLEAVIVASVSMLQRLNTQFGKDFLILAGALAERIGQVAGLLQIDPSTVPDLSEEQGLGNRIILWADWLIFTIGILADRLYALDYATREAYDDAGKLAPTVQALGGVFGAIDFSKIVPAESQTFEADVIRYVEQLGFAGGELARWLDKIPEYWRKALEAAQPVAEHIKGVLGLIGAVDLSKAIPLKSKTFPEDVTAHVAQLGIAGGIVVRWLDKISDYWRNALATAGPVADNIKKVLDLLGVDLSKMVPVGANFPALLSNFVSALFTAVQLLVPQLRALKLQYTAIRDEVEVDLLAEAAGTADSLKSIMDVFGLAGVFKDLPDLSKLNVGAFATNLIKGLKDGLKVLLGADGLPSIAAQYHEALLEVQPVADAIMALVDALAGIASGIDQAMESGSINVADLGMLLRQLGQAAALVPTMGVPAGFVPVPTLPGGGGGPGGTEGPKAHAELMPRTITIKGEFIINGESLTFTKEIEEAKSLDLDLGTFNVPGYSY